MVFKKLKKMRLKAKAKRMGMTVAEYKKHQKHLKKVEAQEKAKLQEWKIKQKYKEKRKPSKKRKSRDALSFLEALAGTGSGPSADPSALLGSPTRKKKKKKKRKSKRKKKR